MVLRDRPFDFIANTAGFQEKHLDSRTFRGINNGLLRQILYFSLLQLRSSSADTAAQVAATVEVVNKCFVRMLRLSEPMDPARPLAVYGIDSLAAVEVRNWIRNELGALVTTVDIMNAASLRASCEKIVSKLVVG
ncbi:acyl carrier protein [Aspergillus homomorphus CBS 101889]|uniref:Carrier domain-containing protein n=1 Tax=Aspergillus homomorphus (strain CBS 101889) TaxID=1450537 RepID=A0A395I8Y9_ASPHC|nr:hypothetical protein BO97DRAFT_133845 [Aspergillus homomorphus CBS 101889]RAL16425.1 hypothetical protein BO97DRAFT_133845 [Aspergillus homomorphus CBS 101889]